MASNTKRTRKCLFFIAASSGANLIGYRLNSAPSNYMCTVSESVPGAGYVGAFQPGVPQVGAQYFFVPGITTEIRSRDTAVNQGSPVSVSDELWARLICAGGVVRAAGATDAVPHTYTLGDIHGSTDVPAGDELVLPFFGIQTDGTSGGTDWMTQEGDNGVTNWSLSMGAGQKPMLSADVYGTLGDGTTTTTNFTIDNLKAYGTEGNATAWYGSTTTLTASGLSAWTPVFKAYNFAVNNVIPVRFDANAALGVAPFQIVERAPGGTIDVECSFDADSGATDTFMNPDHWWRNRLYFDYSSTYVASAVDTAGGSITAKTFTLTQRAYVSAQPTMSESNGLLAWSIPFMIDETATGANAWRISLTT